MSRRTEIAYKAKSLDKLAQHNEVPDLWRHGKCCGCVEKDHVLIRGDLTVEAAVLMKQKSNSGAMTGWGNRYSKSRRQQEGIRPVVEKQSKEEHIQELF